jgi:ADP-ribose pyrophosphatase YjhB (NUDIX family)
MNNQITGEAMLKRRIAVRGVAYENGKILSVLHKDREGNPANFWAIPGGGLDPGESLIDGLYREIIEETGIKPKIGRLLFVQQFMFENRLGEAREELEFFFQIENPEDYKTIDLNKTTHGTVELADCTFVDPRQTNIMPTFFQTIDLESYCTSERPVFIWNELPATVNAS